MTLTTLLTELRYLLDELTVAQSHWSNNDLLTAWFNEAQGDTALRLPTSLQPKLGTTETQNLSNGIADYTFSTERLKIEAIKLHYIGGVAPYKLIDYHHAKIIDILDTDVLDKNALYEASVTSPYAVVFGETITVMPTPTVASTNGLKIYYLKVPTDMVSGSDSPEIPSFVHRWLIPFAASRALQQDGDERYKILYEQYLEHFKQFGGK